MPDKNSKTYLSCFLGKKIRVSLTTPERFTGKLEDIQEYRGKTLLVVQTSNNTPVAVNLDHVAYIEEAE